MNLNKAQIIGRITQEIELKALPSGTKVVNLSVATNYAYKDAQGQKQETTEFHNVIAFGKTAETIKTYFVKGQEIYVEGRLQTRSWDNNGVKMYRTEIVLEKFDFGQKPKGVQSEKPFDQQVDELGYTDEDIEISDIPF